MKYKDAIRLFKVEYFTKILYLANGNVSEAARMAGINRTDFYDHTRRLKVQNPCRQPQPWRKGKT